MKELLIGIEFRKAGPLSSQVFRSRTHALDGLLIFLACCPFKEAGLLSCKQAGNGINRRRDQIFD